MSAASCPCCGAPYVVPAPCSACWRSMSPRARAPWVAQLRRDPAAYAAIQHRDPVAAVPSEWATLLAYIAHLETLIVARSTP